MDGGIRMKKYNLSTIMKRAWEIKRKLENTFEQALHMSWQIAKAEIKLKEDDHVTEGTVIWNIWKGYGHTRAYYKRSWVSKHQNDKKNNYISL